MKRVKNKLANKNAWYTFHFLRQMSIFRCWACIWSQRPESTSAPTAIASLISTEMKHWVLKIRPRLINVH